MVEVKAIFQSRYPSFYQKHKLLSRALIGFIRWLWKEPALHHFAQLNSHASGADYVQKGFDYLNFSIEVQHKYQTPPPATGPVIVVANHPIGSLDGVGLLRIFSDIRPDSKIVANALLQTVKPMQNSIIAADNLSGKGLRKTITAMNQHLEQQGCLLLFPAGKVSRVYHGKIQDDLWHEAFIKMAAKHQAAVVPVYFSGKNSRLFYLLSKLCFPLSTLWLIRELYKFKNKSIHAVIGETLSPEKLLAQGSASQQAQYVRDCVYQLGITIEQQ